MTSFDWITLAIVVIFFISALIGFIRGGFKTFFKIVIALVAMGVAFLLVKPVGEAIFATEAGANLTGIAKVFVAPKLAFSYSIAGVGTVTINGDSEITRELYLQILGDEATMAQIYTNASIPEFLWANLTAQLTALVTAKEPLSMVVFSEPICHFLGLELCLGITYAAISGVIGLLGSLVYLILKIVFKANNVKPSMPSRIFGLVVGIVTAFAISWVIGLVMQVILIMGGDVANFLTESLRLNDPSYWSLGKMFATSDFGYSAILNFFIH